MVAFGLWNDIAEKLSRNVFQVSRAFAEEIQVRPQSLSLLPTLAIFDLKRSLIWQKLHLHNFTLPPMLS
jgi:hypothetical protein